MDVKAIMTKAETEGKKIVEAIKRGELDRIRPLEFKGSTEVLAYVAHRVSFRGFVDADGVLWWVVK